MSDHAQPAAQPTIPAPPQEKVLLGLLASTVAVLLGIAITVGIWRLGFVAAITSLAIAFGAVFAYSLVAGAPRKGLIPVVVLVLLGVVASFFACVASDAWVAYDDLGFTSEQVSRFEFVRTLTFDSDVLSGYGKDAGMFALFAVLGLFGVIRQLFSQH